MGLCVVGALGCQGEAASSYGSPVPGTCTAPCEDDPSKTCAVPCPRGGSGPVANGGSGGDTGSTAGSGGGVPGTVVQFASTSFTDVVPYLDDITIFVPGAGAGSAEVQVDATGGSFTLPDTASGLQWVLAQEIDGTGGAYSTYSIQWIVGDPIVVPVVPFDVIDVIGTQLDLVSLSPGTAQVVLEIDDESGVPIEGVTLALSGATIGYSIAPGQYSGVVAGTDTQGLAVALNVPVPAPSDVKVTLTVPGFASLVTAEVRMAPDTVTYTRVGIDLTP